MHVSCDPKLLTRAGDLDSCTVPPPADDEDEQEDRLVVGKRGIFAMVRGYSENVEWGMRCISPGECNRYVLARDGSHSISAYDFSRPTSLPA